MKNEWVIIKEQILVAEFLGTVKERLADAGGVVDHIPEIVAGEHFIALENILTNVHDCDVCLTSSEFEHVKDLAQSLGIDPSYWNELRVQEP